MWSFVMCYVRAPTGTGGLTRPSVAHRVPRHGDPLFASRSNFSLNPETIVWALAIVLFIYGLRIIFLKLFKLPLQPLLFIAPRGLITILLFLTIPLVQRIGVASKSLTIQVIILTALIMMFGLLFNKEPADEDTVVTELEEPRSQEN